MLSCNSRQTGASIRTSIRTRLWASKLIGTLEFSVHSHFEEAQNYCSQKNAALPAITSAEVSISFGNVISFHELSHFSSFIADHEHFSSAHFLNKYEKDHAWKDEISDSLLFLSTSHPTSI